MSAMFSLEDLTTISDEPLLYDLTLAERLGFSEPRMIRKLIVRNLDELRRHGEVCSMVSQTSPAGGRPGEGYYLNEAQALLICMFSRTAKAADVRTGLIEIYRLWRQGQLAALPGAPAGAAPGPMLSIGIPVGDDLPMREKTLALSIVREARVVYGPATARSLWSQLGLPMPPAAPPSPFDTAADGKSRECLNRILSASIGMMDDTRRDQTLSVLILRAIEEDIASIEILREYGLRLIEPGTRGEPVDETMLFVAYQNRHLQRILKDTPWHDGLWKEALKRLPGARRSIRPHHADGLPCNGVLIPMEVVAECAPQFSYEASAA